MQDKETAYYSNGAISQTDLKAIIKGPSSYQNLLKAKEQGGLFYTDETLFYKEKQNVMVGAAVDYHLSYGQEAFDKLFVTLDQSKKPGEKPLSVAHQVYDMLEPTIASMNGSSAAYKMDTFKDVFVNNAREQNYRGSTKDPVKYWAALLKDIQPYWEALVATIGKKLISIEEHLYINNALISLKTNPVTKQYFDYATTKDLVVSTQVPIYWDVEGLAMKSLLDMVLINHRKKMIAPIDFKVMGDVNTLSFFRSFNMFRYDVQGAFYTDALTYWKNKGEYADYKILPFSFIVESYTKPGMPLIYNLTKESYNRGKFGEDPIEAPFGKKGYMEGIALYKWYEENGYTFPKEVIDNKFTFPI